MAFTSDQPQTGAPEEAQIANYRTVSVAAILALVLGFASALALAHWLLWVLPVLAIVMALVALRHIESEGSNLTGRNLALLAIALALLFGVWAPTRVVSRQNHFYRVARQYSDEWLELLRAGKLQEAHQLAIREEERQTPGSSLSTYYTNSAEATKALEGFCSRDHIKKLIALGEKAHYVYRGGGGVPSPQFSSQSVFLNYVAHWTENGKEREMPLRVVLARERDTKNNDYLWRVEGVGDPTAQ